MEFKVSRLGLRVEIRPTRERYFVSVYAWLCGSACIHLSGRLVVVLHIAIWHAVIFVAGLKF